MSDESAKVYPRVGGGNRQPRMDGAERQGLSPRGRGKRARPHSQRELFRSIPAWAGETERGRDVDGDAEVYPRVGGGNL